MTPDPTPERVGELLELAEGVERRLVGASMRGTGGDPYDLVKELARGGKALAESWKRQRAELDLVKRDERPKGVKRVVYPDADPCELDEQGGHYVRHIEAMTKEGLHHKFEIAEQLGARDLTIQRQRAEIEALTALVRELEWRPVGFGGVLGCPLCGGLKGNGHEPDCRARLAATGVTDD